MRGSMDIDTVVERLRSLADPTSTAGMERVGISPDRALGVRVPHLRELAREIGRDHDLALGLWDRGLRETMILASMIADPRQTTEGLMERWAADFYDWEVTDQTCMNLFEKTPFAYEKCFEWSERPEQFVKRAGFVLMARLPRSDKKQADERFLDFFPALKAGATDGRNGVKKAVNWAIREIGKRSRFLNPRAIELAREIGALDSSAARWVAADAIRELTSEAVRARLRH
jgi:3-methyladenine DNA glycosylase AlkD